MANRTSVDIPTVLGDAASAMRRMASPLAVYIAGIVLIQLLASTFLSGDLLSRQGFHSTDAPVLGLSLFLQVYLSCGLLLIGIRAVRGQVTTISSLLPPFGVFFRGTFVVLAAMIPIALGFILFIVPGAYLALTWSQAYPLILDARAHLFDSLRISAKLTKGVRGKLFLALLVPALLALPARAINRIMDKLAFFDSPFGAVILIVVGLWEILVMAFGMFLAAVLYQRLQERADAAWVPATTAAPHGPGVPPRRNLAADDFFPEDHQDC